MFPKLCSMVFAVAAFSLTASAQRGTASLNGAVVNGITEQPLRDAEVSLQREGGAERLLVTSTVSNGAFQLSGVEPGRYILFASRSGYEPGNYTSSGKNAGRGAVLHVAEGAAIKALTIRLNPMAAVSGRVMDEQGEPMAHVSVEAKRYVYFRGRKQMIAAGQASTDDLGEYRIFGLARGAYMVHAQAQVGGQPVAGRTFSYTPVYYPNSLKPESAVPLALAAGQLQRGIDFTLQKVQTFSVQGHVAGAGPGTMVYLAPKGPDGAADMQEKRPVSLRDGHFEIPSVIPGSYVLAADQFGDAAGSARVGIEIRQENVRGVELTLVPMAPVSGRVTLEGPAVAELAKGMRMRVGLESRHDGFVVAQAEPDNSGRFQFKGVVPGNYRLAVSNVPAGLYVKSLRAGDADISQNGLDLSQGVFGAELNVVMSAEGGALKGASLNATGTAVAGVQVVAIPVELSRETKQTVSDQAGHFEIKDLAPGEYMVLAFEDLERGVEEDGDFMKRFTAKASRVSVTDRSTATVDPLVVPAEQSRIAP